jgi:phage terminase small subunit
MAYNIVQVGDEEVKLTDKELLFVNFYLSDSKRNATQAAIRAGFSENSARTYAAQTLAKGNIKKYIQFHTSTLLEQCGVEQRMIVQELAKIGFSDITDFMEDNYSLKPLDGLDKRKTGSIQNVKVLEREHTNEDGAVTVNRTIELKLHDKMKALERLAEMAGLTRKEEDPDQETGGNFFQQINNYYNS